MDDTALWEAFSAARLPAQQWTHHEHLRVAWMFLKRHPLDEAHILMRVGIIRLNAFHGLVETPSRGYHETLTRVWLTLVGAQMKITDAPSSDTFLAACGDKLRREAVFEHYSRDHVLGTRARAAFAEPDLRPLPS